MRQVALFPETNQRLAEIVIRDQDEDGEQVFMIKLPHRLHLPSGVDLRVDGGETLNLPFQSSDSDGVYALQEVADELLEDLRRGLVLNVSVEFTDGRRATIPLSLAGFTAAHELTLAAGR